MARPTRLTDQLQETLCAAVERGLWLSAASRLAGLHPSTTRRWLRLGRQRPNSRYGSFFAQIKRAEAELQGRCLDVIRQAAAGGTWQAAGWLLERKWPEAWSDYKREVHKMQEKLKELEGRLGPAAPDHNPTPPWERPDDADVE